VERGWIGTITSDEDTLRGGNDFKIMLLSAAIAYVARLKKPLVPLIGHNLEEPGD
jgi:hypothetical protein